MRRATAGLALIQSLGLALFLQRIPGAVVAPGLGFVIQTVILCTGAALVVAWLGEIIIQPRAEGATSTVLTAT